jgi:WD40 repeat protein
MCYSVAKLARNLFAACKIDAATTIDHFFCAMYVLIQIRFSNGGHLFVCAVGISISVFSTYSQETTPLFTFSGHAGSVKRLLFSADDRMLFSAGAAGGVYAWSLVTGTRNEEMQHVSKGVTYTGAYVRMRRASFASWSSQKKPKRRM